MSELSIKMKNMAKDGYKVGMVRHIAQSQKQREDKQPLLADIKSELEYLTLDSLAELYQHIKGLIKQQGVWPEAPACPRIDEQEVNGG